MTEFRLSNCCNANRDVIFYNNDKELGMILSTYENSILEVEKDGKILTPEQILKIKDEFEWDYLSPEGSYILIDLVKLPNSIQDKLSRKQTYLDKKFTHKQNQNNVLLSEYEKYDKSVAFRAYYDWKELDSDHISDHVDGIKLFEIARQGMLASFHINNLQYDSAIALTSLKIDYIKYVETFVPFIIHLIPIRNPNGKFMFALFGIYQVGQLVAKGYFGVYAFASKIDFTNKRKKLKEGVYKIAEKEHWTIIKNEKKITRF